MNSSSRLVRTICFVFGLTLVVGSIGCIRGGDQVAIEVAVAQTIAAQAG